MGIGLDVCEGGTDGREAQGITGNLGIGDGGVNGKASYHNSRIATFAQRVVRRGWGKQVASGGAPHFDVVALGIQRDGKLAGSLLGTPGSVGAIPRTDDGDNVVMHAESGCVIVRAKFGWPWCRYSTG